MIVIVKPSPKGRGQGEGAEFGALEIVMFENLTG